MTSCEVMRSFQLRNTKMETIKYSSGAHFDPELTQVMRNALEVVMTRVPWEHSTPAIKAYLAECILKAAAQGRISYDELVAAGVDQIQAAISRLT
jgi:hypothetical protein